MNVAAALDEYTRNPLNQPFIVVDEWIDPAHNQQHRRHLLPGERDRISGYLIRVLLLLHVYGNYFANTVIRNSPTLAAVNGAIHELRLILDNDEFLFKTIRPLHTIVRFLSDHYVHLNEAAMPLVHGGPDVMAMDVDVDMGSDDDEGHDGHDGHEAPEPYQLYGGARRRPASGSKAKKAPKTSKTPRKPKTKTASKKPKTKTASKKPKTKTAPKKRAGGATPKAKRSRK